MTFDLYIGIDYSGQETRHHARQVYAAFGACYVRVSTVGQNQAGQKREIKLWLAGNGIDSDSVRWFTDIRASIAEPYSLIEHTS